MFWMAHIPADSSPRCGLTVYDNISNHKTEDIQTNGDTNPSDARSSTSPYNNNNNKKKKQNKHTNIHKTTTKRDTQNIRKKKVEQ